MNLQCKTHDLLNKRYNFTKDKFVNQNWKGVISEEEEEAEEEEEEEKKDKPALLTRICPPGLALAGPDMSEVRVLVPFCTFRTQN